MDIYSKYDEIFVIQSMDSRNDPLPILKFSKNELNYRRDVLSHEILIGNVFGLA